MLTARVLNKPDPDSILPEPDPDQRKYIWGIVVWAAPTPSHVVANFVLQRQTFKAYALYRNAFDKVEDYIGNKKDECTARNVFPIGTRMLFDTTVDATGLININHIWRAERSIFFNAPRMMRGFAEDADQVFVDLLNVKIQMTPDLDDRIPPGVPFIGLLTLHIDADNYNPHADVKLKLFSLCQFTMERFDVERSGWGCRQLSTLSNVDVQYGLMPGFLRTNHATSYKNGPRKVLMFTDTGFLFDYERPNVPIIIYNSSRSKPSTIQHGHMVWCYLFESCLTDYLYGFTSYKRKRTAKTRIADYDKNQILFKRNIRVFLEAQKPPTLAKEKHKKPVVLICNVVDKGGNVLKTHDHTYYLIHKLREEGFTVAIHREQEKPVSPTSIIRDLEGSQKACPYVDGHSAKGFEECIDEIHEKWGRLDFILLMTDVGAGPKKMPLDEYLFNRDFKLCKALTEGARNYLTRSPSFTTRFFHIQTSVTYLQNIETLFNTMRGIGKMCNKVFTYTNVSYDDLSKRFSRGHCGFFAESEAVVEILKDSGYEENGLNDKIDAVPKKNPTPETFIHDIN